MICLVTIKLPTQKLVGEGFLVASLHICNYTIVVSGIRFEWDEAKNLTNQRKHGVSFQLASQVFLDPLFVSVKDRTKTGSSAGEHMVRSKARCS